MTRPPRRPDARLFDLRLVALGLLQGASVLAAALLALSGGVAHTGAADAGRALAFAALVGGNLGLILVNRSWSRTVLGTLRARNVPLWWLVGSATVAMVLAFAVPPLRRAFRFGVAGAGDLLAAAALGLLSLGWFEVVKRVTRRRAGAGLGLGG